MVSLSANSTIISSTWPGFVLSIFGFLFLIKESASFAYCPVFPLPSFKVFNSSIVLSRTTIWYLNRQMRSISANMSTLFWPGINRKLVSRIIFFIFLIDLAGTRMR